MRFGKSSLVLAFMLSVSLMACSSESADSSTGDRQNHGDEPNCGEADENGNVTDCDEPDSGSGGTGEEGDNTIIPGTYGAPCGEDTECGEALDCVGGKCGRKDHLGSPCSTKEECTAQASCVDSACRKYVDVTEVCDGVYVLCHDGYSCLEDTLDAQKYCLQVAAFGEECNDYDIVCASGHACYAGTCAKISGVNGECGEEGMYCESGLSCRKGKCKRLASQYDVCDAEDLPCRSETAVCYEGECLESSACSSDAECQADTYCCTEEACAVKNVCLPYGIGPRDEVNEACTYKTVPGLFEADIQCEWLGPKADEPKPGFNYVVVMPIVAKTPHDTGTANTVIAMTYKINHPGLGGACNPAYSFAKIGTSQTFQALKDAGRFDTCKVNHKALTEADWKAGKGTYDMDDPYDEGVIRFIHGETCALLDSLWDDQIPFHGGIPPVVADVDGDGNVEIFVQEAKHNETDGARRILAYHWNSKANRYTRWWESSANADTNVTRGQGWEPFSIHDINNDGVPELILPNGEVINTQTGVILNSKINNSIARPYMGHFPTIADLDGDGKIELSQVVTDEANGTAIPAVYEWDIEKKGWVVDWSWGGRNRNAQAIGDFGTPGPTPGEFNWGVLDGKAEVVSASGQVTTETTGNKGKTAKGHVYIYAMYEKPDGTKVGQKVFEYGGYRLKDGVRQTGEGLYGGGAPTVGDFDGDTLPEVAVAYGDEYVVFDPRCKKGDPGCADRGVLWRQKSQDVSSYVTGSSLFDFDGDGATEVVYADECYTRVYDGKTGEVLFSARTNSRTWLEMPIIVDVDNDESAEIVVGANQTMTCDLIDPIHRGVKCAKDADCTSKVCQNGLCRCTSDNQCNWRKDANNKILEEYRCTDPLEADKAVNAANVCRARHERADQTTGIRIMRDKLDRWASSRNLWNQQSYSITNINDDQTIPKTEDWVQNFTVPGLNNYRANSQGSVGMNRAPDITGKLNKENLCRRQGEGQITLTGLVCNRGTKMVASKMPASFYEVTADGSLGQKFCTAYTASNVPVGGCLDVSCPLELENIPVGIRVRMVSNDDGDGGRTTVECNDENNTDEVVLESCPIY